MAVEWYGLKPFHLMGKLEPLVEEKLPTLLKKHSVLFLPSTFNTNQPLYCDYCHITYTFYLRVKAWVDIHGITPVNRYNFERFLDLIWL